jgi:hypothetical protein
MDPKYDENGQAICPFCESLEACEHWVCTIDVTDEMWGRGHFWWNCHDGQPSWLEEFQKVFLKVLFKQLKKPPFHKSERLMKVWEACQINILKHPQEEEIEMEVWWPYKQGIYDYLAELLVEQGGILANYDINQSPGFSGTFWAIHAEKAGSVDDKAYKRLIAELNGKYSPSKKPKAPKKKKKRG